MVSTDLFRKKTKRTRLGGGELATTASRSKEVNEENKRVKRGRDGYCHPEK